MIRAAIFDLDGTVLSDEQVYGGAFRKVLKDLGVNVKQKYPHKGGIGVGENWPYLLSKYKVKTNKSLAELSRATQQAFLKNIADIEVKEGFEEFIVGLREIGVATALATSNEWFVVEEILDKFNLAKYFDVVVTGEEATAKKPDPELFIIAAQRLGVDPRDCVAFEDSAAGIEAGKRAGMVVIGVARDEKHAKELDGDGKIINNYAQAYDKLEEYLGGS
ncbi:hypothetical protein A2125_00150 [Candidatus Woesebacteria bacterium GWB1_43_5]|uniref:Haloacid dehalogenase n=1 Tax=Candidatus Woesebacteria bacterium GWB1_43_5 TaxID=1802474 RepID=A0A1F7WSD5_9BACT|nr:MAG: hypothetical protein A2125_00150 [Candidatus Woesebacteria bacterium GWB1_43_5]